MFDPSEAGVRDALNELRHVLLLKQITQTIEVAGENLCLATNASAMDTKQLGKVQGLLFDVIKLCDTNALMLQNFQTGSGNILEKVKAAYLYLLDGFPDFSMNEFEAIAGDVRLMGDAVNKQLQSLDAMTENLDQAHSIVRAQYDKCSNDLQSIVDRISQTNVRFRNIPKRAPVSCQIPIMHILIQIAALVFLVIHCDVNVFMTNKILQPLALSPIHSPSTAWQWFPGFPVVLGFVGCSYFVREWILDGATGNIGNILIVCSTWSSFLLTTYSQSQYPCAHPALAYCKCYPLNPFYIVLVLIPVPFFVLYRWHQLQIQMRRIVCCIQITTGPCLVVMYIMGISKNQLFVWLLIVGLVNINICVLICIAYLFLAILKDRWSGDQTDGSLDKTLRRQLEEFKTVHLQKTLSCLSDALLRRTASCLDSMMSILRQTTVTIEGWYAECKGIVEPSMGQNMAETKALTKKEKAEYWNSPAFKQAAQRRICWWKALQVYCEDTRCLVIEKKLVIEGHYTKNPVPEDAANKALSLAERSFPDIRTIVTDHFALEKIICQY